MKFKLFLEAFKDMGKLTPDQLKKGQRLDPNDDNFTLVDGRVFFTSISKIKDNDLARMDKAKGLDTLSIYSVSEYKKMKCYLGQNNSSGYCLKKGSELVSVFSTQGSSGYALMTSSIVNGAKHLDCYAERINDKIIGQLFRLYSKFGFRIDVSKNEGTPGKAYSIVKGVSSYVDDKGVIQPEDKRVVIFMKR